MPRKKVLSVEYITVLMDAVCAWIGRGGNTSSSCPLSEDSKPPQMVHTAFFHYLVKLAKHIQGVWGISAMCADGCVACWGSGKVVCTSWTTLCLVGWCSATPGWGELAGLLRAVWDITLPCAKTVRMGHNTYRTNGFFSGAGCIYSGRYFACEWSSGW